MEGHCLKPMQVLWILPQSLLDKSYAYIFWFSFLLVFWGVGWGCLYAYLRFYVCLLLYFLFVCFPKTERQNIILGGWVGR